ncbi:MAG TPA: TetR/AcrR family transcriptional regulator [Noviherbaspirillum sp.]|nr:TetR/AcrR family transcriptional regulator [Noviherbaspirillum sp.]
MRYPKEHKEETRRRIVDKAGERFRNEGIEAVGLANLMQSVGLTVGGFYAHFGSREDLVAEACEAGFARTTAALRSYLDTQPRGERTAAFIDAYLSPQHRDEPGAGCMIAANGAELARHPASTRAAFTAQVDAWIGLIDAVLAEDGLKADARALAAGLVGTMVLARAVNDPARSDAFLESGRKSLKANLRR